LLAASGLGSFSAFSHFCLASFAFCLASIAVFLASFASALASAALSFIFLASSLSGS